MYKLSLSVLFLVFAIGFGVWAGYKNWTTGGEESDYEVICLGGHQYYRANWANKALLGIKLTTEGKPVKCGSS